MADKDVVLAMVKCKSSNIVYVVDKLKLTFSYFCSLVISEDAEAMARRP